MNRGWGYAAASVIGTSHLKTPGESCQDFNCCSFIKEISAFIGVVSDGAGSAPRGGEGSMIACETVLARCSETGFIDPFSRDFSLSVLSSVQDEIRKAADEAGLRKRDYACTLLVAIIGNEKAAFWQIGDGAICFRLAEQERFNFAFWPAKGEYANITEFVTDENAEYELSFDSGEFPVADLALFSDGLERLVLNFAETEVHTPFLAALFPYLHRRQEGHLVDMDEQLSSFLASERVNKCTDDDKTLILATREHTNAT